MLSQQKIVRFGFENFEPAVSGKRRLPCPLREMVDREEGPCVQLAEGGLNYIENISSLLIGVRFEIEKLKKKLDNFPKNRYTTLNSKGILDFPSNYAMDVTSQFNV